MRLHQLLGIPLLAFVCAANATIMTGNDILTMKRDADVGTRNYLNGYIAGLLDATEAFDLSISKCIGEGVRTSQLVDAVALYLEKNPQIRNKHPMDFFGAAIKRQWGCK